jgi:hypothetical protein
MSPPREPELIPKAISAFGWYHPMSQGCFQVVVSSRFSLSGLMLFGLRLSDSKARAEACASARVVSLNRSFYRPIAVGDVCWCGRVEADNVERAAVYP